MSKRCYIAGAGEFDETKLPAEDDYIIAADGGYASLIAHNLQPDLIVGDFDSLPPDLTDVALSHPNVIRCDSEKDDTDMMLAVRQGLQRGFKTFVINGGLGGRLDQTLANMQILEYIANNDARGCLVGHDMFITVIKNTKVQFTPDTKRNSTVSIFCAGDSAEGVTLKGLKYPLTDATLTSDNPIGVSNETTGQSVSISVKNGTLIIIFYGGNPELC